MTETQEIVLKSVKEGNSVIKEIVKNTGLSFAQVTNSLKRLRKWGDIETNYKGNYTPIKNKKLKVGKINADLFEKID